MTALTAQVQGQTVVYSEDFDGDPACAAASNPWTDGGNGVNLSDQEAQSLNCSLSVGRTTGIAATSPIINLSSYSDVNVSFWAREDEPESGDRVDFQYQTSGGSWVTFEIFNQGSRNTVLPPVDEVLPSAALHANSRFRAFVVNASGAANDRWQFDDFTLTDNTPAGPQIYTVTNTNDSGAGSLRQAIIDANNNPGADTIEFNIAGSGEQLISYQSPYSITDDGLTIDGTTQAGSSCGNILSGTAPTPQVRLDGIAGSQTSGGNFDGFDIDADNVTIKGLALTSGANAVHVFATSSNTTVECNVFGIRASGVRDANVRGIFSDGPSTLIQDNLISGSVEWGVQLRSTADNSVVQGNAIGLDQAMTAALANEFHGVGVQGADNVTIGGTNSTDRNIISGNTRSGIEITANSTSVSVLGNYIGLNVTGTSGIGNAQNGIDIERSSLINIGNGSASGRNVIAGNGLRAIVVDEDSPANITIDGNYIGTDQTGNTALTNGSNTIPAGADGIAFASGSPNNVQILNNVIGGFPGAGIEFFGVAANIVTIQGNSVGVGANGTSDIGSTSTEPLINFNGGTRNYSNVTIGGLGAGEGNIIRNGGSAGIYWQSDIAGSPNVVLGNTIADNTFDGVLIQGSSSKLAIYANSIFDNGGLAVDINTDGVQPNDNNDGDGGTNDLLNFPVINSLTTDGATTITYDITLDTVSHGEGYRVDFYRDNSSGDTNGEGETWLGFVNLTYTGVTDDFTGSFTAQTTLNVGDIVTAKTTRRTSGGSFDQSSEFGPNQTATNPLVVTNTNDSGAGSLRAAIDYANTNASADNITFDIPNAGPHTITLASSLTITDDGVTIDGTTQSGAACGNLWAGTPHSLEIVLDGVDESFRGIQVSAADGVTIKGLSIVRFSNGINVYTTSSNSTASCNYIGLYPDGTVGRNTGGLILNGSNALAGGPGGGDGNVISGNAVAGLYAGADIQGFSAEGNFIGTSPDGLSAAANGTQGILQFGGTSAVWGEVRNNLISGNNGAGISIPASAAVTAASGDVIIAGNYIGVNRTGTAALANGAEGIFFDSGSISGVTIGGTTANDRNVISGNTQHGLELVGVSDVDIFGNYIGVGADGSTDLGNRDMGIYMSDGASDISIGNGSATGRNIISGNEKRTIRLQDGTTNISVNGNYLGVDATGNAVVLTGENATNTAADDGVVIAGGTFTNTIVSNNLMAGFTGQGIETSLSTTINGLTVQGNTIGELANGAASGTGSHGIVLTASNVSGLIIGGDGAGEGNLISNSGNNGIHISTNLTGQVIGNTIHSSTGDGIYAESNAAFTVLRNSLYDNGDLGIDLNSNGVRNNDSGDGDGGTNEGLNFPVLNEVTADGTAITFDFDLDVPSNVDGYRIEFFANSSADGTGHGEGETYLGFYETGNHAGGSVNYTGSFTASQSVAVGTIISATTTRKTGGSTYDITSEFAQNATATSPVSPLVVTNTNDSGTGSLRAAIEFANANAAEDAITFDIPNAGPHTITIASALPAIIDAGVSIDGTTQTGATCGTLVSGTPHDLRIKLKGFGGDVEHGLRITGGSNQTIRGLSIGGFGGSAIYANTNTSDLLIECNYISVDPDGATPDPNTTGATIEDDILIQSAANTTIRNNLFAGNMETGADAIQITSNGGLIEGNLIGTDETGNTALSYRHIGVVVVNSPNTVVGGTTASQRNIFGGSPFGIRVTGAGINNVSILGNDFGVGQNGTANIGGTTGIQVDSSATSVLIGDGSVAGGNRFANLSGDGITVLSNAEVAILGNSFNGNGELAIDIDGNGVTPNDPDDTDTGANSLLNFPVLNAIVSDGGTTVNFDLDLDVETNANGYRIQFYANMTGDGTGYGEGETYLGFYETGAYTAGTHLNYVDSFIAGQSVPVGTIISATATRKTASSFDVTSEFAQNATTISPLVVTNTNDSGAGSLRAAILYANANASEDAITFDIPGASSDVHTIALASALPTITDADISIDGTTQGDAICGNLWAGTPHTIRIEIQGFASSSTSLLTANAANVSFKGLSVNTVGVTSNDGSIGIRFLAGGDSGSVQCSYIGLRPDGSTLATIYGQGVSIAGDDVVIGGLVAGEGNVISTGGNSAVITTNPATGVIIQGNFLGTDATGMVAIGQSRGIGNSSGAVTWSDVRNNLISGNTNGINTQSNDAVTGATASSAIAGNYIGVDRTGLTALPNTGSGFSISGNGLSNIIIGGTDPEDRNIISGNGVYGISLNAVSNVTMLGNYIGLGSDGATSLGNGDRGIYLISTSNASIGNGTVNGRNVIGSNLSYGIHVADASDTVIDRNYIGLNSGGDAARGNGSGDEDGLVLTGAASNTTVQNNTVSGNSRIGIYVNSDLTTGTLIDANIIGLNSAGTAAIPNATHGIQTNGGAITLTNNTSSGNGATGYWAFQGDHTGTVVTGNNFGLNLAQNAAVPNSTGAGASSATNLIVGDGTLSGANLISGNTGDGFTVLNTAQNITLISNLIFDNGDQGIDLGNNGVTANDPNDTDTGPNDLLNFPVINSVTVNGTTLNYDVTLDTPSDTNGYRVEFFANSSADASGHGEGETYLGFFETGNHAGGSVNYTGSFTATQSVSVGTIISATTTRKTASSFDSTSEFSANATTASPLIVTNTNDSGAGSLRAAIDYANANASEDNITFNIPNAGPHVISIQTSLPQIVDDGVSIDASTQSGAVCGDQWSGTSHTLQVELDPSGLGPGNGLNIGANDVTIRGLSITGANLGIVVSAAASGTVIECNFIGLQPDGTMDGNQTGVHIVGSDTIVGGNGAVGNVISGNVNAGIWTYENSANTSIIGNFIGTSPDGLSAAPNSSRPIGHNLNVGTWREIKNNLISGNDSPAIILQSNDSISGSDGNVRIQGNYIGVDRTGNVALPNDGDGLDFAIGSISNVTIGGTTTTERNIISGNNGSGIDLNAVSNISILDNYIGLGADGTTLLGNANSGINANDVTTLIIGDGTSNGRPIISANGGNGIELRGSTTATVQDAYIGTDATGLLDRGNSVDGVRITNSANLSVQGALISGNDQVGFDVEGASSLSVLSSFIGVGSDGTTPMGNNRGFTVESTATASIGDGTLANANIIAHSTIGDGVRFVTDSSGSVIGNRIFNNAGLGIALSNDGVSSNDLNDTDVGPNNLINFPVINTVSADGTTLSYDVTLDVPSDTNGYRIEFFANSSADASGHGEGETYLGFFETGNHAGGSINYTGSFTATQSVSVGTIISATTTRQTASSFDITSEFSANVTTASALVVTNTNDSGPGSLRAAIDYANANPSEDNITFNIPNAGPHVITLTSTLPYISDDDVTVDGTTQSGASCGDLWSGASHTLQIELDGVDNSFYGPYATGNRVVIKGLSVVRFLGGIVSGVGTEDTQISCNYVGLRADGTAAGNTVGVIPHGLRPLIGGATGADGNVISASSSVGISVGQDVEDMVVENNFVGTDPTGLSASANGTFGIQQHSGATTPVWDRVSRNLISGNTHDGILIGANLAVTGSEGTLDIQGNYIGVNRTASSALPNGSNGIEFQSGSVSGVRIGGTSSSERNIIAGNDGSGIDARSISNLTILGNYIGVDNSGNAPIGNGSRGIFTQDMTSLTIGNGTASGRNIIGNSAFQGIVIDGATGAAVNDNYIGIGADGSTDVGNAGVGLTLVSKSAGSGHSNTVVSNNIVSANGTHGIDITSNVVNDEGANAVISITGNKIGVAADGSTARPNAESGIKNSHVPGTIRVGGETPADANIIAHNGTHGIRMAGVYGQMAVFGNSIYSNDNLAIDLADDGVVTANDPGDGDSGHNDYLNFPVINTLSGVGTTISYDISLDVPAHGDGYRVDFYKTSVADTSGHGEGETYLGFANVAGSGTHTGSFTAAESVAQGDIIAATTTRRTATGWDITSEFSLNYASASPTELTAEKSVDVFDPTSAGLYALPGNDIISSLTVTNPGNAAADADSIVLIDAVPAEMTFYNGDMDDGGPATHPVHFTQTGGAGLTFTYATDAKFSNSPMRPADMAGCTYTPSPGYDANVTFVCFNPKGAMAAGNPDPTFTVSFRARIK